MKNLNDDKFDSQKMQIFKELSLFDDKNELKYNTKMVRINKLLRIITQEYLNENTPIICQIISSVD